MANEYSRLNPTDLNAPGKDKKIDPGPFAKKNILDRTALDLRKILINSIFRIAY